MGGGWGDLGEGVVVEGVGGYWLGFVGLVDFRRWGIDFRVVVCEEVGGFG